MSISATQSHLPTIIGDAIGILWLQARLGSITTNAYWLGSLLKISCIPIFRSDSAFAYTMASITAFSIALKVHNRKTIQTSTLANLSKGEFTVNDIIAMECSKLFRLTCHLLLPMPSLELSNYLCQLS